MSEADQAQIAARRSFWFKVVSITLVGIALVFAALFVKSKLDDHKQTIVATEQATPDEIVPCTPEMLDMSMSIIGNQAGRPTSFNIAVKNTSETSCSLDSGRGNLVLKVESGDDKIWQSNYCVDTEASDLYVFGPGVESTVAVHWSGARATEDCQSGLPTPGNGTYVVSGSIGGQSFDQLRQVFELGSAPPPPPATEEPKPSEEATPAEDQPAQDDRPTDAPND